MRRGGPRLLSHDSLSVYAHAESDLWRTPGASFEYCTSTLQRSISVTSASNSSFLRNRISKLEQNQVRWLDISLYGIRKCVRTMASHIYRGMRKCVLTYEDEGVTEQYPPNRGLTNVNARHSRTRISMRDVYGESI